MYHLKRVSLKSHVFKVLTAMNRAKGKFMKMVHRSRYMWKMLNVIKSKYMNNTEWCAEIH